MKDYELILKAISYARDGQKLPDSEADAATAALARIYAAQQSVQATGLTCPACQVERQVLLRCPKCMSLDAPRV